MSSGAERLRLAIERSASTLDSQALAEYLDEHDELSALRDNFDVPKMRDMFGGVCAPCL
jgi:hypothetical protein